ncbi:hypothetical protein AWB74_08533 [Caballeronia arvi]|uniref:Uncharacterized protein n=1 Tax=Caballeronia arvi TaxID=1777135 RepID=A0A158L4L0_9BURK|nr:hypothetical protein AWB74_08533 [Caballeronia arvi]
MSDAASNIVDQGSAGSGSVKDDTVGVFEIGRHAVPRVDLGDAHLSEPDQCACGVSDQLVKQGPPRPQ